MSIPYRNAQLLLITAAGSGDNYDVPSAAGADRWAGSVGIYVDDSRQQITTAQRIDEDRRTRLEVPWSVGKVIQSGDVLTFTFNGSTETGVAADLKGDPLVGRRQIRLQDR